MRPAVDHCLLSMVSISLVLAFALLSPPQQCLPLDYSPSSVHLRGLGANPTLRQNMISFSLAQGGQGCISSSPLLMNSRFRRERTLSEVRRTRGSWRDSRVRRVRCAGRLSPSPHESVRPWSAQKSPGASCHDDPESRAVAAADRPAAPQIGRAYPGWVRPSMVPGPAAARMATSGRRL